MNEVDVISDLPACLWELILDKLSVFELNEVARVDRRLFTLVVRYWEDLGRVEEPETEFESSITQAVSLFQGTPPGETRIVDKELHKLVSSSVLWGFTTSGELKTCLKSTATEKLCQRLQNVQDHGHTTPVSLFLSLLAKESMCPALIGTFLMVSCSRKVLRVTDVVCVLHFLLVHHGKTYCYEVLDQLFLETGRVSARGLTVRSSARRRSRQWYRRDKDVPVARIIVGLKTFWPASDIAEYMLYRSRSLQSVLRVESIIAEMAEWAPFFFIATVVQGLSDGIVVNTLRLLVRRQNLGPVATAS
ncbi:hypothetical protein NDN08_000083 [Rhodosorus marinus]|uniref:F-box domain-containing protein n=1 Tax=Rhodosorus marinus TaxID=101924 RepID=A0AAV8UHI7_9RHOD|nr:hypothetical protein NDN08_000083 [Rhodosorus marinus]